MIDYIWRLFVSTVILLFVLLAFTAVLWPLWAALAALKYLFL